MEALQKKLSQEVDKIKNVQKDIQKLYGQRQKLDAQLNENTIVKEELALVDPAASNVYKLIGPVLVKQDLVEAKQNVDKRIEYITGELKRHDNSIQDLETKMDSHNEAIGKIQQQMQAIYLYIYEKTIEKIYKISGTRGTGHDNHVDVVQAMIIMQFDFALTNVPEPCLHGSGILESASENVDHSTHGFKAAQHPTTVSRSDAYTINKLYKLDTLVGIDDRLKCLMQAMIIIGSSNKAGSPRCDSPRRMDARTHAAAITFPEGDSSCLP
ncbi:PFDN6 [Cordylochernes scorpioides]|uniref:PFDN6 n=2 Tax=Cordylochernes scorpioides TaxID=51811 RepID=A0ABY6LE86_9ARAC|nr:PFDN6 [Cordylochernes scorpioides]